MHHRNYHFWYFKYILLRILYIYFLSKILQAGLLQYFYTVVLLLLFT